MSEGGFEIAEWPYLKAWAGRLKAMPDFAVPYDLIPVRIANSIRFDRFPTGGTGRAASAAVEYRASTRFVNPPAFLKAGRIGE